MSHHHLKEMYGIEDTRPVDLLAAYDTRIAALDALAHSGRVHHTRIAEAHAQLERARRERAAVAELIEAASIFADEMNPIVVALAAYKREGGDVDPSLLLQRLEASLARIGGETDIAAQSERA